MSEAGKESGEPGENLRLFREALPDPREPGVKRLLFEATGGNLYLYAWIGADLGLRAFQVVWMDDWVLSWKAGGTLSFGAIGRQPFNRAISPGAEPKRDGLLQELAHCHSDLFPALVEAIQTIARGENSGTPVLGAAEGEIFRALKEAPRK